MMVQILTSLIVFIFVNNCSLLMYRTSELFAQKDFYVNLEPIGFPKLRKTKAKQSKATYYACLCHFFYYSHQNRIGLGPYNLMEEANPNLEVLSANT